MRHLPAAWLCPTVAILCLTIGASWRDVQAQPPATDLSDLKTVAESSDYQATSQSDQVVDFVNRCATAEHVTAIQFGSTVEGRPMVAAVVANPPCQWPDPDDPRLRILLLGNIHSGECAGKEALLALLRELASNPDHPWLKDAVVMIAPNYNADANDRMGPGHRPGQIGPVDGMGLRENAMHLDLNRDFVKLESPEARSLVRLVDSFDPHMFIDCHTTNGSQHQYVLTYDVPHNPTSPREVRDFLRNNMMPAVTRKLREEGRKTFYYGNFSRDYSVWSTYGHEPRYSTEYIGLRGRLGILSEAYSYASYPERIAATGAFVRECVNHLLANGTEVRKLLDDVREQDVALANTTPEHQLIHLQSRMVPFAGTFIIEGIQDDQPQEFEVSFAGDYQPTTTVSLPWAYLLPAEMSRQAERLQMHGIQMDRVIADTPVKATIYDVKVVERSAFPFQGHQMVSVEAAPRQETVVVPADTFLIRTAQPLGRLAAYLLEPETNDGLVTWNFFDQQLAEGSPFPVMRIDRPAGLPLVAAGPAAPAGRLRLEDIFGPDRIRLPSVSLDDVNWLPDGQSYTQQKNRRSVAVDAESGAERRLQQILDTGVLENAFAGVEGITKNDIREMVANSSRWRGPDQTLFVLSHKDRTFIYDLNLDKVVEAGSADDPVELVQLDPRGQRVAWVRHNNLYLLTDADGNPEAVTRDGSENILNGKLDWVYQEELYGRGNFRAFWWSPDGQQIAWLRTDESPVARYTVTDHQPVRGRQEITAYPKAGDPLPMVTLHVRDLATGEDREFPLPKTGEGPGHELLISRVTWDPADQTLLVQIQNRIQSWLDLYRFNPANGTTSLLFRDQTRAWISTPGDPVFLKDGSFLWLSPRTGFNSIWHYASDGRLIRQLVDQPWEVRELTGCDEANGIVYFSGTPETPTRVVPLAVPLAGGRPRRLTDQPGTQTIKFNPDYSRYIELSSTATTLPRLALRNADGSLIRILVPNRDDRLRHLDIGPTELVTLPVGQGDQRGELDAMLIKPPDFDPQQRYPVVTHIYGGPQAPRVRDRFGGQTWLWHQYLAQQGYVVFVVDNRSCSYHSAAQAWPIYRNLAATELADLEDAIGWLGSHPWVDTRRIGLWGWSYGGYMTAYALTHSDRFAAGIAGAPVTDWRNYDAIYTERYMDTPQANPGGYDASSVLKAAGDLQGALLLIHGTIDDNVHLSNTFQLVNALQQAGKPFELMVYPGNRHGVRNPVQRLHLFRLMTDFFRENL